MMEKTNVQKIIKEYWGVFLLLLLLVILGKNDISYNYTTQNDEQNQQLDYYCCSSGGSYSCSLNSCQFGASKVYVDSFNTLSGCNAGCVTPNIIQKPVDQSLTCEQKAAQLNALFYTNPVSTAKECLDFAKLDCQDTGKILDGYGVSGTCCYYTCIGIVTPDPIVCHVSDSDLVTIEQKLQSVGTCTDSNGAFTDNCDGNMLRQYYCEPGMNGGANMCGYTSYNCEAIIPGTICQGGKCVASNSACDANCDAMQGYNSGACFVYNPNGAVSMANTCLNNNGVYAGATGCISGTICCCR